MSSLVFADYDNSRLLEHLEKMHVDKEDKEQNVSFHFNKSHMFYSRILRLLQLESDLSMKELTIRICTRGLHLSSEMAPAIRECVELGMLLDRYLDVDEARLRLDMEQKSIPSLRMTDKKTNFYPGKKCHDAVVNNFTYCGITKSALCHFYFFLGISDYDFGIDCNSLNKEIEDILRSIYIDLENRLETLRMAAKVYTEEKYKEYLKKRYLGD